MALSLQERAADKDEKRGLAASLVTNTIEEHIRIKERKRFLLSVAEDLGIELSQEEEAGGLDEDEEDDI